MRYGLIGVSSLLTCVMLIGALPADAQQGRYNGHCSRLTRQVSHFQDVADRARERDDELWLASTAAHIERLRDRRRGCVPNTIGSLPAYAPRSFGARPMR